MCAKPVSNCFNRLTILPASVHVTGLRCSVKPRFSSTSAVTPQPFQNGAPYHKLESKVEEPERTFQRLSTRSLLRGVLLGQIFKTPLLYKPSLWLLEKIANARSGFLNVDQNPLIRAIVVPLIYQQFCAGTTTTEVRNTIADIKAMGYSGVILCWSGEIMAAKDGKYEGSQLTQALSDEATKREIRHWKDGYLATLDMAEQGDYMGVKYTGAGPSVSEALKQGNPPSPAMLEAIYAICDRAQAQNKQIWIDAEQQVYHPTIDNWTIDLMRKYNRNGRALVSTTIQAYLKSSRSTTEHYLRLAQKEGWTLGIKLVRGAYIGSDTRTKIHDTKSDTDTSYDSIAHDILTRTWPGLPGPNFPHVALFLAGHNTNSVRKASTLVQQLAQQDAISERVSYGQLQGIADDIGCELLALGEQAVKAGEEVSEDQRRRNLLGAPRAYKCLQWGTVKDSLHFLVRRAIENQGAAERLNAGLAEMKRELRRRALGF